MLTTQKEIPSQDREDGSTEDHQCEEKTETNPSFNKPLQNPPSPLPCSSCCVVLSLLAVVFSFLVSLLLLSFLLFLSLSSIHPNKFHMCEYRVWSTHYSSIFCACSKKGVKFGAWGFKFWAQMESSHSMWYIPFKETWNTCWVELSIHLCAAILNERVHRRPTHAWNLMVQRKCKNLYSSNAIILQVQLVLFLCNDNFLDIPIVLLYLQQQTV